MAQVCGGGKQLRTWHPEVETSQKYIPQRQVTNDLPPPVIPCLPTATVQLILIRINSMIAL